MVEFEFNLGCFGFSLQLFISLGIPLGDFRSIAASELYFSFDVKLMLHVVLLVLPVLFAEQLVLVIDFCVFFLQFLNEFLLKSFSFFFTYLDNLEEFLALTISTEMVRHNVAQNLEPWQTMKLSHVN